MASDIGAAFRALHEADGAFLIPNPWDLPDRRCHKRPDHRCVSIRYARDRLTDLIQQLAQPTPLLGRLGRV